MQQIGTRIQHSPIVLAFAGALLSTAPAFAQAPVRQWDQAFGGSAAEALYALQPTSDGGYILGGMSRSGISGDKTQSNLGDDDYWVVKLSATGTKQWDRRFGTALQDAFRVVRQTSDGGYILGGWTSGGVNGDKTQASRGLRDYWIVKLDANGTKQWDKAFGGNNEELLYDIQLTPDGGYILAGTSSSLVNGDRTAPSRGIEDYWIVKLDANGTKQWDKAYGGGDYDGCNAIQPTSDGGYILGGQSFSGIGGDKTQSKRGDMDYWLVKIDASGTKQWDRTFGGTSYQVFRSVRQTSDGGYFITGYAGGPAGADKTEPSRGTSDFWVVKTDATGAKQWDRTIGSQGYDWGNNGHQTADGGYIVSGISLAGASGDKTHAGYGGSDLWLVKLDAAGSKQWDRAYGGTWEEVDGFVYPHPDGSYVLAGHSDSPVSGDKSQASRGGADFWLLKTSIVTESKVAAARRRLALYPNPAHASITLRLGTEASREDLRLTLLDATGRTVLTQAVRNTGLDIPVDVSQQPAGLYLVRVTGPNGYLATQHLVLE